MLYCPVDIVRSLRNKAGAVIPGHLVCVSTRVVPTEGDLLVFDVRFDVADWPELACINRRLLEHDAPFHLAACRARHRRADPRAVLFQLGFDAGGPVLRREKRLLGLPGFLPDRDNDPQFVGIVFDKLACRRKRFGGRIPALAGHVHHSLRDMP